MPIPEKGPIDQWQTYQMREPSTTDMHYYYPSHKKESESEGNEMDDNEWALKKTLRDIDSKIKYNKDQKTKQGQLLAEAAEAARAKYKKQQNGQIFDEIEGSELNQAQDAYENYVHHKAPNSNILYDIDYNGSSEDNSVVDDDENGANDLRENFTKDADRSAELGKADEEDLKLDQQMHEDEKKLKDEFESKLEELKGEYISKMKDISDTYDEKHKDLQSKRMDIERQYEEALAEFTEKQIADEFSRPHGDSEWRTSHEDYYGGYDEDSARTRHRRGHRDFFDSLHDFIDYPYKDE